MKPSLKRVLWIGLAATAGVALVASLREQPVLVDVAPVIKGPLTVTVEDDGFTRVRERFTISAPVLGRLVRTPLDPGDPVRAGETVVAEFTPISPDPLDERSLAEAQARFAQAEAGVQEVEARFKAAEADKEFAESELSRVKRLVAEGIQTDEFLERTRRDHTRSLENLRSVGFQREMARFGRELARAALRGTGALSGDEKHGETGTNPAEAAVKLRAPVSGRVLRVFEESARTLPAGTPILELGDVTRLEIVADFLSQDAVKVRAGMRVTIDGWGGEDRRDAAPLRGVVRLVEPSGFTKISALGVEEQRVNVVIDPDGDPDHWAPLGDGFRVEPRIELFRADDVLQVASGALFRQEGAPAVFRVVDGVARVRRLRTGRTDGRRTEVLEGLVPGDTVILFPSDLIREGRSVRPR